MPLKHTDISHNHCIKVGQKGKQKVIAIANIWKNAVGHFKGRHLRMYFSRSCYLLLKSVKLRMLRSRKNMRCCEMSWYPPLYAFLKEGGCEPWLCSPLSKDKKGGSHTYALYIHPYTCTKCTIIEGETSCHWAEMNRLHNAIKHTF